MSQDQNKKSLRNFQCRDYLWEIFEQMGAELECSVDYLINEAMRQYARSRNYGVQRASQPSIPRATAPSIPSNRPSIPSLAQTGQRPSFPTTPAPGRAAIPRPAGPPVAPPPGRGSYPPPAGPPGSPSASQSFRNAPRPSARTPAPGLPPGMGGPPGLPPGMGGPPGLPPGMGGPPPGLPPGMGGAPPPLPPQHAPVGAVPAGTAGLYVIFNGQKFPVNKEEFVIGRGSKTSDLPIKDGNISRRHAAVIFHGGQFYMKDLGSTNGVEYGGQRIDSKRIEEGDVFHICDYELRFTYYG